MAKKNYEVVVIVSSNYTINVEAENEALAKAVAEAQYYKEDSQIAKNMKVVPCHTTIKAVETPVYVEWEKETNDALNGIYHIPNFVKLDMVKEFMEYNFDKKVKKVDII